MKFPAQLGLKLTMEFDFILKSAFAEAMIRFLMSLCLFTVFLTQIPSAWSATQSREDSIRAGRVWQQPDWISGDEVTGFSFDPVWNMALGPSLQIEEDVLRMDPISCLMTNKSVAKVSTGWTAKFFCEVSSLTSKPLVKVKYHFVDGEVSGELLGTRLLWALGFGADRVYYFDRIDCHGCTENPHHDRRIDSSTLQTPRPFSQVAIERKFPGNEIKIKTQTKGKATTLEGFSFHELQTFLPTTEPERLNAQTQREALKLLAVFIRHADNKSGNQAMYCSGRVTSNGGCDGDVDLLIHDLGLTFGSGFYGDWKASKAIFDHWDKAAVWKDAAKCQGEIGLSSEQEMEEPLIHEEGRLFLVQLLKGFSNGPEGRKRVEQLFLTAHADQRYGTIDQWVSTFYRKLKEMEFPLGETVANFSCPQRFKTN